MTASVLRRAAGFIKYGDPLSVTILSFDHRQSTADGQKNLAHNGHSDGLILVRNMWDNTQQMSDSELRATFTGHALTSPPSAATGEKDTVTKNYARFLNDAGKTVREEHYRDDGTVLFADDRPAGKPRRILLHTQDGTPFVEYDDPHTVYNNWIKHTIDKEPSVLVADPGIVANITSSIGPRRFKLVHFLHVSHLERPVDGSFGELVSARAAALRNFEQFDFTAVQTQTQIDDMVRLGFPRKRMHLIPSEISPDAITSAHNPARNESKGIVAGRLVDLKQIDHAITAVAQAKTTNPSLTLDICGTGPDRNKLQTFIDALNLNEDMRLHGHVDDLTHRMANASFSLLTSKYEGLGLAIVESMAAGCIPITYDIKYGPGGIITHGVNGYIVDTNDTNALATQITEFLNLPPEKRRAMREAAVERARDFLPERSYNRWKTALEQPVDTTTPRPFENNKKLRVRECSINAGKHNTKLGIVFADNSTVHDETLQLVLKHRTKNTIFQTVSTPKGWSRTDGKTVYNFTLANELFAQSAGQTFDVSVRRIGAPWDAKVRLSLSTSFNRIEAGQLAWFRTKYGNLSIKVQPGE